MTNQSKNPIFIALLLVLGGVGLTVLGYIKQESTKPGAFHGSGGMMAVGIIIAVIGFVIWFTAGGKRKQQ